MKNYVFLALLISLCNQMHGATFYLDPVNGSLENPGTIDAPWNALEEVITAGYIVSNEYSPLPYDPLTSELLPKNTDGFVHAGDTLVLLNGLHGDVFLRNYVNQEVITIIGAQGHAPIIEKIKLQGGKNWRFENLKVSTEEYGYYLNGKLFHIESHNWQGPCSHIYVENCELYSTIAPWNTATEWIDFVSDGLYIRGDSVEALNNTLTNVNMGLTAYGDHIIAEGNQIINFSGDGMRLLGSNNIFRGNLIKNCYDVDDNHDDGIQSFAVNGIIVDDNQVIGNIIINTDDDTRPLNGPLQGIGCFDGFYNNWLVANNIVSVNHWHGITFLGANDCQIINNTVIDPTPDITPGGSWIRINAHKDGTPSSNCLVANNVANQYNIDGEMLNNFTLDTYQAYADNFVDYLAVDFHLTPTSILIDAADPAYAPEFDLEGNSRLLDAGPDVGALEYVGTTTSTNQLPLKRLHVYPNPFSDQIHVLNADPEMTTKVYNLSGNLLFTGLLNTLDDHLTRFSEGIYILKVTDRQGQTVLVQKLIKY